MRKTHLLLATSLLLLGIGCDKVPTVQPPPVASPPPGPVVHTYQNAELGFTVVYPDGVLAFDDKAKMATSGYVSACDPESAVACFVIPSSAYAGKNFESAGFAVNVLKDKKTEKACLAPSGNMKVAGKYGYDDVVFATFSDGDAAMSHYSNGLDALTFRGGTCWELTTRTNTSNFEVYEPGMIQRFTEADQNAVDRILSEMLQSFRFKPGT